MLNNDIIYTGLKRGLIGESSEMILIKEIFRRPHSFLIINGFKIKTFFFFFISRNPTPTHPSTFYSLSWFPERVSEWNRELNTNWRSGIVGRRALGDCRQRLACLLSPSCQGLINFFFLNALANTPPPPVASFFLFFSLFSFLLYWRQSYQNLL